MRIEYLYVFFSIDFPWRGTVGVSSDVESRRLDIQGCLRDILRRDVTVRLLWKMPVITSPAYDIETSVLGALRPLHCSSLPGSGRSGWFWTPNLVTALCLGLLLWGFGVTAPATRGLFLLLLPVPLDFALVVTALAFVQYGILTLIIIFGWRIIQLVATVAFL